MIECPLYFDRFFSITWLNVRYILIGFSPPHDWMSCPLYFDRVVLPGNRSRWGTAESVRRSTSRHPTTGTRLTGGDVGCRLCHQILIANFQRLKDLWNQIGLILDVKKNHQILIFLLEIWLLQNFHPKFQPYRNVTETDVNLLGFHITSVNYPYTSRGVTIQKKKTYCDILRYFFTVLRYIAIYTFPYIFSKIK